MAKTAISPWEKKEKELLAEMPEALRPVALDLKKKRLQMAKGVVMIQYDMGARLDDVMKQKSVYGANAASQLAAFMGWGEKGTTTLYDMINFSLAFTRDQVESFLAEPMANGAPLTYGHFLAVTKLKSKADQIKLLKRSRVECLGVKELSMVIRAEYATKNKREGGRHHKPPATPLAGLQRGFSEAQKLYNYMGVMEETVFTMLEEIAPDQVDERHLQKIEEFRDQVLRTSTKLEAVQKELVPVEERIRKVLESKAEQIEAAAEDETVPVRPPEKKAKAAESDGKQAKRAKKVRRRPAPV